MIVTIKQFDVAMKIKNKGIEIDVCDRNSGHIGDLVITGTKVIWCRGRTSPQHGIRITWTNFIKMMEQE